MPANSRASVSAFKTYLAGPRMDSSRSLATEADRPASPSRPGSWTSWAGQKVKQIASTVRSDDRGRAGPSVEKIYIFPGWASRRYHDMDNSALRDAPFDVQVAVNGWCSSHNSPESLSRSQKAFIRLAKGYASLPKLPTAFDPTASDGDRSPMTQSTEDLIKQLHLPPPPSEMNSADAEIAALEEQLRRANLSEADLLSASADSYSSRSRSSSPGTSTGPSSVHASSAATSNALQQMHSNLESRLLPFWSSVLPARFVRLSLFVRPNKEDARAMNINDSDSEDSPTRVPIAVQHVQTAHDGSYSFSFGIPWERLCTHPGGVGIAFGDPSHEHKLQIRAELLAPLPPPPGEQNRKSLMPVPTAVLENTHPVAIDGVQIDLSHSPVRVLSDIDDTIKYSNILSGARSVFFNVFVKDLTEALIPGMPEWYNEMWKRGVRFHYVSNGPFEILPVINDFFHISKLPAGSVRLRSYAGRSLFNGIFTAPAARKRAGVLDVLDSFPFSRFLLVGDSGEQDLELYAQIASERPRQILAVFVRDVNAGTSIEPVEDPTGAEVLMNQQLRRAESPANSVTSLPYRSTGALSAALQRSGTVSSTTSDLEPPNPPYASDFRASAAREHMPRSPSLSSNHSIHSIHSVHSVHGDVQTPTPRPTYAPYKSARSRASSGSSLRSDISGGPRSAGPTANGGWSGYFSSNVGSGSGMNHTARSPSVSTFASSFTGTPVAEEPELHYSPQSVSSPAASTASFSQTMWDDDSAASRKQQAAALALLSEPERKRQELQVRVNRARATIPATIPFRVFRDPRECVEAAQLLDKMHIGTRTP